MLVLSRSDILSVLDMDQVIRAVEDAHAALATGAAADLGPASLKVAHSSTLMVPMVAALGDGPGGVKLLMDTPDNGALGRPTQQSTIVLVDTKTGSCEAFLDGGAITMFRTAAASAVATKYLARQNATVLGFIGAGGLAGTHLEAIRSVRPIRRVNIWSRNPRTAIAFARYAEATGIEAHLPGSPQSVVASSDILCTLTPSREPIVHGRWFNPGLHINAVGAPPRNNHREIDTDGIQRSRVIVDSYQIAATKSGEVLIPLQEGAISADHFRDELGHVITGARPPRTHDDQITLYNSIGLAIQDIATAHLVVTTARAKGLGTEIPLAK